MPFSDFGTINAKSMYSKLLLISKYIVTYNLYMYQVIFIILMIEIIVEFILDYHKTVIISQLIEKIKI